MSDISYEPVKHNREEFLREARKSEEFRKEYCNLEYKYTLIKELLRARREAGMTQEAVAQKIGTTKSAISRLESGGKSAPSIATVRRYANAVGCDLVIKLEPKKESHECEMVQEDAW